MTGTPRSVCPLCMPITISQGIPVIHIGSVKQQPSYLVSITKIIFDFRHFCQNILSPVPIRTLFISSFRCQKRQGMPRTTLPFDQTLSFLFYCLTTSPPSAKTPPSRSRRHTQDLPVLPHGPHPLCFHHISSISHSGRFSTVIFLQLPIHHKDLMDCRSSSVSCIPAEFTSTAASCAPDLSSKQFLFFIRKFQPFPRSSDTPFSPISAPPFRINCPL